MIKSAFLNKVKEELDTIKRLATSEEIAKLELSTFDPHTPSKCIYGQMTGECSSDRAKELFPKILDITTMSNTDETYKDIKDTIYFYDKKDKKNRYSLIFTPLEVYLPLRTTNVKQIIEYLKGERDQITLR